MPVALGVRGFDPLGSDADAELFVPFYDVAIRELLPFQGRLDIRSFRASFSNPQFKRRFFGSVDDDAVVCGLGVASHWRDGTNEDLQLLQLFVRPDCRRRGLGTSLLARASAIAAEDGRSVVWVDTVDTVSAGSAFAEAVGADPVLCELISVVAVADLDVAMLDRWSRLRSLNASGYELLRWLDDYPRQFDPHVARLTVVGNTDMPNDDLDLESEFETGETVRERLERTRDTTRRVTTVARHIESGRLVGFSELVRNHPADPVLDTSLTVVDPDHRGHGIGKRMKADVILRAITRFPDVTHIRTRNASSNTHMLRINDAIGFAAEHAVVAYQAPFATIDDYLAHRSASE